LKHSSFAAMAFTYMCITSFAFFVIKKKNLWNDVEGKKTSVKEKIEAIDDDNRILTYSLFDGEISESYKSFKGTLQVIDKENNGGIVKWTFEYEKLSENITAASPESYLEFASVVTKDIDDHLLKE